MKIKLNKRELALIKAIQEIPDDCFIKGNILEIEDSKKIKVIAVTDTLKDILEDK